MDILGIGRAGMTANNYIPREIKSVSVEAVRRQDEEQALRESKAASIPVSTQENQASFEKAGRIANLQDISLTFNAQEDYGYLGKDSQLETLDVQKAISDMQKDGILQQYQYFVGSSNALMGTDSIQFASGDGMVIQK